MPASTMPSRAEIPAGSSFWPDTAARGAGLAVVLVAFALRAYHLDYQSLWSDEGISLLRASQRLGDLWRTMPVEHVPGYFALLHGWIRLTGVSDYALRYLSLLPSVFAVALMMRTGRDLGSRRIGMIAATLFATSAFQVWYGQEVRMYSWLLAAGMLSTWLLWLMLSRPPSTAIWIGYVLSTTAAIYLHYFGFLIPAVHTVVALIWLIMRRDVRSCLRWLGAGAAVFVLFLPWSMAALQLLGFTGWRAPIDPSRIPWLLLQTYSAGETMPDVWTTWIPLAYLALALIGTAVWMRPNAAAGVFLFTIALGSVLLTWLLVVRQPDFHVRYTIFISAPLTLLVAGGVAGLDPGRWRSVSLSRDESPSVWQAVLRGLPGLALGLLVVANGVALNRLYRDASVHKPDFRSAAAHIQDNLQPGDIVLVDGPNPQLVFDHYYDGAAPVFDLRRLDGLSDTGVDAAMQEITEDATRAWELLYFKPPGPVQVWLATRGWTSPPEFHNNIRVQLAGLDGSELEVRSQGIYFGDALELVSSEFDPGPHEAGDLVRVSTNWQVHQQAPEYKFSLRLEDEAGRTIDVVDYVPQNWFAPTNVWFVDRPATDQHGVLLPDDLEPGPYRVTLRLYDPHSGSPVDTAAGVDVPIADFVVTDGSSGSE